MPVVVGFIQRITPDGGTVGFSYDGDRRTLSDGNGSFNYDGDGNMLTASNAYGTYVFSYDSNDQLTQVTEPYGVTLNFANDADGNRTLATDSFGGTQASYYDGDNYLTEVTYSGQSEQIRFDFTNNGDGMPTTITSYSDLAGAHPVAATDEGYDGDGNVTSIYSTNAGSTVLQNYSYSYNSKDQLTSQVENGVTTAFAYDSSGQLTSAGGASYGYDANGNRDTGSDTVTTGNEMSSDGTWNYSYDKEGNLIEKVSTSSSASWTYAYNASNELTEVKQYNSEGTLEETIDYKYDAFGEEIEQDVSLSCWYTTATKFAYDGWNTNMPAGTGNANFMQWAVLNGDDSLQSRNINGNMPGQHLARVDQSGASDPSGVYFILNDRLNSVRDVIDTSGTVQDAINYDVYGNITSETDATYRGWYAWTGMETDQQTGLQYNNARWYSAETGTWMTRDPMGFDAGDSNLYRYVNNRPTIDTDPSGMHVGISMQMLLLPYIFPPSTWPPSTTYYYRDPWVKVTQGEAKDMIVARARAWITNIDVKARTYKLTFEFSSEVPAQKVDNPRVAGGGLPAGINLRTEQFLRALERRNRVGENMPTLDYKFNTALVGNPDFTLSPEVPRWNLPADLNSPKNIVLPTSQEREPSVARMVFTFKMPASALPVSYIGLGKIEMQGIGTPAFPAVPMRPIYIGWNLNLESHYGSIGISQRGMPRIEE